MHYANDHHLGISALSFCTVSGGGGNMSNHSIIKRDHTQNKCSHFLVIDYETNEDQS